MGCSDNAASLRAMGQQPGEAGPAIKYDPAKGYGQRIRDLAQAGEFPEVWVAKCGVTKQTLRTWCEAHPEFQEDMVIAFALLEAFWSRMPLRHLTNPDLRSTVLMETLGKRLPSTWSNAKAHDMQAEIGLTPHDEVPLTLEQKVRRMSTAEIEAKLERYQQQREILKKEGYI